MPPDRRPAFPSPGLLEIPWPTEVTPDDIAEIKRLRTENRRSLVSSVAQFITDEADQMYDSSTPDLPAPEDFDFSDSPVDVLLAMYGYTAASIAVLDAEEILRTGEVALASEPEELKIVDEVLQETLQDVMGVDVDVGLARIAGTAENYLERTGKAKLFLTTGNPLAFVDLLTEEEVKKTTESRDYDPEADSLYIEGLRRGQDRFHQLYQAAQAEGL